MSVLIDKFILLLFTVPLLLRETGTMPVTALLTAFTASCVLSIKDDERLSFAVSFLYGILCSILPSFGIFLPLFCYDCVRTRLKFTGAVLFLFSIPYLLSYTLSMQIGFILSLLLSVFLSVRTQKLDNMKEEFKKLRDDSTELNLLLKKKNQYLQEKQETEIHLATLKERNRIAREIHDNVGHMLSRSILQLGALKALNQDSGLSLPLGELHKTLNTAMDSIRTSVHGLQESSVSLHDTVSEIIQGYPDYTVDFAYDISEAPPQNLQYCFAAIIKEAFTNTAKHSNASHIHLVLREHPSFYQLLFEDNGSAAPVSYSSGMGLSNMKERIEAFHGTINISFEHGFKIFITVPHNISSYQPGGNS
ncbi:sensor histidine kinase [Anaerostipes sp.]|uniref:sensor histidine kinase n=1 Tax=Anaerostipes sp. TaxID=1872530 RepID=UPI0025C2FF41|nr:histidine kinase [Anaerostipes sp.]MBS7008307.1 two-component sensor histidine kinase [Anaerostipes sp.]